MRHVAAALFCVLLAMPSLAASVVAEGASQVGREGAAGARRAALADALSGAVKLLIHRHVPAEALAAHEREITTRYLSRPTLYILRHAVVSETDGVDEVRVRIAATVDEEKLLADLAGLGLPVKRLEARPRVLLAASQGEASAAAAKGVGDRLAAEGYAIRFHPKPVSAGAEGADPAVWAKEAGYHFALVVSAQTFPEITEGEGKEGEAEGVQGLSPLVCVRGRGRGWVVPAAEGETAELSAEGIGAAATEGGAHDAALQAVSESLAQRFLAEMILSGWKPGTIRETVEIRVVGLTSPGQMEALSQAFGAVTEIRSVTLARVERGSALWRAETVRSGFSWPVILGTISLSDGTVEWEETARSGAPLRVDGRWPER